MGAAQGGEGFQDFFHVGGLGAEELLSEVGGGAGLAGGVQGGFDGLHALGEGLGPGQFSADGSGLARLGLFLGGGP